MEVTALQKIQMWIALPASTDIYLTGGKSHVSETRLAKFLIQNLEENDHFLDIGAHYGYFTLLAAELVGTNGQIKAFEPSTKTFALLSKNTQGKPQIEALQSAVSETEGEISFYEFPNLYSEYNTKEIAQFENEAWFQQSPPKKVTIAATTIDKICNNGFLPKIIKIDVEGAELEVIKGGEDILKQHSPTLVMEYLTSERQNAAHRKASELLQSWGYSSYRIDEKGNLEKVVDIDGYLKKEDLESDNIVLKKL